MQLLQEIQHAASYIGLPIAELGAKVLDYDERAPPQYHSSTPTRKQRHVSNEEALRVLRRTCTLLRSAPWRGRWERIRSFLLWEWGRDYEPGRGVHSHPGKTSVLCGCVLQAFFAGPRWNCSLGVRSLLLPIPEAEAGLWFHFGLGHQRAHQATRRAPMPSHFMRLALENYCLYPCLSEIEQPQLLRHTLLLTNDRVGTDRVGGISTTPSTLSIFLGSKWTSHPCSRSS